MKLVNDESWKVLNVMTEHVSSHHFLPSTSRKLNYVLHEPTLWTGSCCFLPVYYQSNEWAGVYGTRERDHEAWSTKQDWGSRSVSSPQQTDELTAATSSSSCSRTACLPPSSGRTSSSCWTSSSSCAASWRRGLESSRHAEPPTSTASGLPRQTGSVRSDGCCLCCRGPDGCSARRV